MPDQQPLAELKRLDEITRRLRRECPWDREQDERTIVPHTVEEAYELADAAHAGDDGRLRDELGDVLFQVMFLSLLLEERSAGSLAEVADACTQKLIRRHPHVFGDVEVADAGEVRRNWDEIKLTEPGRSPGLFDDIPENLPSLLHAAKAQRRGASASAEVEDAFTQVGDLLFAAVSLARRTDTDPELALREATRRFTARTAEGDRPSP